MLFFFFKQKPAYEMRISDWSSDVCSSDLEVGTEEARVVPVGLRLVRRGVHLILGRPAAPVGGAARLRVPHVRPVAVARLALDLDLDAGLLGGLLVEQPRVARAGAGDYRGAGLEERGVGQGGVSRG